MDKTGHTREFGFPTSKAIDQQKYKLNIFDLVYSVKEERHTGDIVPKIESLRFRPSVENFGELTVSYAFNFESLLTCMLYIIKKNAVHKQVDKFLNFLTN